MHCCIPTPTTDNNTSAGMIWVTLSVGRSAANHQGIVREFHIVWRVITLIYYTACQLAVAQCSVIGPVCVDCACLQRVGGRAGGRCPNLTSASARAVFASLWALFLCLPGFKEQPWFDGWGNILHDTCVQETWVQLLLIPIWVTDGCGRKDIWPSCSSASVKVLPRLARSSPWRRQSVTLNWDEHFYFYLPSFIWAPGIANNEFKLR